MLYKSGVNLESGAINFIENNNNNITLFSAYLKLEELKSINQSRKINRIIVRWEIKDLCIGVSDLELYHYCIENNIALYRNTRIHLKALWNNEQRVFFGSANVTRRGLGEEGNYNFELNGEISFLSYEDITYFNEIILNSEYVTKSLFERIEGLIMGIKVDPIEYPNLITKKNTEDSFLLSSLPMTESVAELYLGYCNPEDLSTEEINYVSHDMALYNIPRNLYKSTFYSHLKVSFNSHPFIVALKEFIKNSPRQSLKYGEVVRWIQNNTTTVPTPRSWEIKREVIVNILYSWICDLDENYYWDIPGGRSQVIYYRKNS